MPQHHYLGTDLGYGRGTQAFWSRSERREALIFVHGFGGDPITTWLEFPAWIQSEVEIAGYDVVFFGYDGLHTRSHASAYELRLFLEDLFLKPLDVINASLPAPVNRPADFRFDRFTLVTHSLGAVVARQALLDGYKAGRPWAPLANLVLFAPAHRGANLIELLLECNPIALPIYLFMSVAQLLSFYTVLQDLKPDCLTLRVLLQDTEVAINTGASKLMATRVIMGSRDNVVHPIGFPNDPASVFVPGRGHSDICKPDDLFVRPVIELREALK